MIELIAIKVAGDRTLDLTFSDGRLVAGRRTRYDAYPAAGGRSLFRERVRSSRRAGVAQWARILGGEPACEDGSSGDIDPQGGLSARGAKRLGLRQLRVPDTKSAAFKTEAKRESLLVAQSPHEADDQAFVDSISEFRTSSEDVPSYRPSRSFSIRSLIPSRLNRALNGISNMSRDKTPALAVVINA